LPFYGAAFIALDTQGNMYITDNDRPHQQSRLLKLSPDGQLLNEWHVFKSTSSPVGLAVDGRGNIYVAARNESVIYKIDPSGQVVMKWRPASGSLPIGLSLDQQGNVYVALFDGNTIQKYSPDGQLLATFGGNGSAVQFTGPLDVAVDGQGHLYITDQGHQQVQELGTNNQSLMTWGNPDNCASRLALWWISKGQSTLEIPAKGLFRSFPLLVTWQRIGEREALAQ
jgi:DNA-binding beta-propeller fold protein YncE